MKDLTGHELVERIKWWELAYFQINEGKISRDRLKKWKEINEQAKAQIVALLKNPMKLPEITDEWADKMTLKIYLLIKEAQKEDLISPVTDRYYLGKATDIVTSIINDLRPKNK